jgi:hypothetical protein
MVSQNTIVADDNSQFYQFTAYATGGVAPYLYRWDFGDGHTVIDNPVTHSFNRPGEYRVVVTVTDSVSSRAKHAMVIEVSATPFSLSCYADPTEGEAPLYVDFRAAPDGNVGPVEILWEFGDGASSTHRITSHTYEMAGRKYEAIATGSDGLDRVASCSKTIRLTGSPCNGKQIGGFCWYLAGDNEDCNSACADHGGYSDGTRTYAGSAGTNSECQGLLSSFGFTGTVITNTCFDGYGCIVNVASGDQVRCSAPDTNATSHFPGWRRACACNE